MIKHRRGPWSQTEDQYLLDLVQSHGAHNWVRISQLMQSRSPKQCRERYHQNLKPSLNLNPITPEEGVLIERMVAEMGKRWAEIARRLHGRSDNAVKNWWNGGMNRRKRLDHRRADAAARQAQHQPYPAPSTHLQPPQYQPSVNGFSQMFQYPVDQHRLQPHSFPQPIMTTNVRDPSQRSFYDAPLPSPSAWSNGSRNDSVDGGAPSLISDMGSYSSQSHSPNTPTNPVELPPLAAIPGESHSSLPKVQMQPDGSSWATTEADYCSQFKQQMPAYGSAYYSYPPFPDPWRQRQYTLPSQNPVTTTSPGNLPLPSFRTVATSDLPPSSPTRDSRDSRMDLSTVVS